MKPWANPDHESYHGKPLGLCFGCSAHIPRSAWGWWCHPCNVKRLTAINKAMAGAARSIGYSDLARDLSGKHPFKSGHITVWIT